MGTAPSGHVYYYNMATQVTQWEFPTAPAAPPPPPGYAEYNAQPQAQAQPQQARLQPQPQLHAQTNSSWPQADSGPAKPWQAAKDISELPLDTYPNDTPELASFRKEHSITTAGDCPAPFLSFDECGWIPQGPRQAIAEAGFDKPSSIQAFSWKAGLEGRDVVGVAKTGAHPARCPCRPDCCRGMLTAGLLLGGGCQALAKRSASSCQASSTSCPRARIPAPAPRCSRWRRPVVRTQETKQNGRHCAQERHAYLAVVQPSLNPLLFLAQNWRTRSRPSA